jgi:protocatechuate 3,4-dioxygenase beta subunit
VRIVLVRGATLEGDVVDVKDRFVDGVSIEVIGSDLTGLPVADSPERISFRRSHFSWSLGGPRPLIPAGELGVMPGPIPPIPRGAGLPDLPAAEPGEVGAGASVEPWVTRLDGTFKAFPVTPGRVRALVRHPAYVEGISEAITLAPGASGKVQVVLLAGGTLEGRLVDSAGRGVSNARIDLTAVRGTLERTTITASDGTFAFAAVPDQVIVSAARPDDPSKLVVKKSVEVPEGGRAKVEITLPAPRDALRVVVRDDSGRPVESAQVSVLSVDPNAPLRQTAFTGSDGSAAIEDARGLDLRILVEAPGFAVAVRSVEHAGERVQIDLARGVTVEGKVTTVRGRRPLEGASITLISEGRRSFALSDRDGAYRMRDVAPGPVHVVVTHPDFATAELDTTVVSTGRSDRAHELPAIDLAEGGGIEGEVLDAQGKPAVGARVAAGIVPAFLPLGSLPPGMAVTDGKGRFKLAGLAPGRVDVEAYAPDLGRGVARRVSVAAGRNTTGVSIRLTAPVGDADPSVTGSVAITLGERGEGEGLEVVIVHVADGSEAERGGLRAGDVVLAVDGADVADMRDARARLSGPPNSDVVVEVDRAGQTLKLRVGREAIRR